MSRARLATYLARRAELQGDDLEDQSQRVCLRRDDNLSALDEPVLVVGAGGLGVEIVKNLALMGYSCIHIVDMDTISLTNLNRQFIYCEKDIGMYKAKVAAEWIQGRLPGVTVHSHTQRIEDLGYAFLRRFKLILLGLDSVKTRRWINAAVQLDARAILIEAGSEGFKGHARVIEPNVTACYECTLGLLGERSTVPLCTLASRPRNIRHCVLWALIISWPRSYPEVKFDGSNMDHLEFISTAAINYAKEFNMEYDEITPFFIRGVVNNIVPAIASTNSIIAGLCAAEAFKITTRCVDVRKADYIVYVGDARDIGIHSHTFKTEPESNCPVCNTRQVSITVSQSCTVSEFLEIIKAHKSLAEMQNPSISNSGGPLYIPKPEFIEINYRGNLKKPLLEFAPPDSCIDASGPGVDYVVSFKIRYNAEDTQSSNQSLDAPVQNQSQRKSPREELFEGQLLEERPSESIKRRRIE